MNYLREQIEMIEARLESMNNVLENEKVQGSKTHDRVEKMITQLMDLKNKLVEQERRILKMDPCAEKSVLEHVYFLGMGLEDVAKKLGYTVRHCRKLHIAGLQKMKES